MGGSMLATTFSTHWLYQSLVSKNLNRSCSRRLEQILITHKTIKETNYQTCYAFEMESFNGNGIVKKGRLLKKVEATVNNCLAH